MTNRHRWLGRIKRDAPLAVVLGGSINGLCFSRSLGRRSIPTLMLDSRKEFGMYTRYGRKQLLPPIEECEGDWLIFLEDVGKRLANAGVVFATSDASLLFLSRYRDHLGKFFRFIIPDARSLAAIVNKRQQYSLTVKAGIPVPKTAYPESMSDTRAWRGNYRILAS